MSQRRAAARQSASQRRQQRLNMPPTWRSAILRALGAAALLAVAVIVVTGRSGFALMFSAFAAAIYIPSFYYFDLFMYRRRQRQRAGEHEKGGR